ncbi:MAG TPA: hypothetical protein ENO23_08085 [Alphaproteobacteria bacterium]|nr:hypothetical protein [Alphaproteobacteria bacterium]
MDCTDYRRMITLREDGELVLKQLVTLEEHLSACADCRAFAAAVSDVTALHASLGEASPSPGLLDDVMAAIGEPRRSGMLTGWLRVAVPAAAAIVLFAGVLAGTMIGRETFAPVDITDASSGLEYLEPYPPGSVGEALAPALEGGETDE